MFKQMFRRFNDGGLLAKDEIYKSFAGFQHTQSTPSDTWNIEHYIGEPFKVSVFVDNIEVKPASILQNGWCSTTVKFNTPVSGFANLTFLIDKNNKCEIILPTVTPSPTPLPSPTPTPAPINSYISTILDKSPLVYWPLTNGLNDVISSTPLTLRENASLSPDSFGNTLSFSASGTTKGSTFNTISLTTDYTLEAWINPSVINAWHSIIGTNFPAFGLQFDNIGKLYIYGNALDVASTNAVITVNNYIHVVAVVNANGSVDIYINGSLIDSAFESGTSMTETFEYAFIGTDSDDEYFVGNIGDPAIYDYALNASQVLENYNAGLQYRYGQ